VKRTLGWRRYVRYMDDLVLVGETKPDMTQARDAITQALRLTPHPRKTQLFPVKNGVPFLGFRLYPHGRRILRANLRRFSTRVRRYARHAAEGTLAVDHARASLRSWLGFAAPHGHGVLFEQLLDMIGFREPGRAVPMRFTLNGCGPPLQPRAARRVVEQQREQRSVGQPQQHHAIQPEQQQRVPAGEHWSHQGRRSLAPHHALPE